MNKKITAIDIGNRNIHIVEGTDRGTRIDVHKAINVPCPGGTLMDGMVENRSALKYIVQSAFSQQHFGQSNVVLTVQSNSVLSKDILLPIVRMEDMNQAVIYEMEQYLPNNSENYNIEYRLISEIIEGNVRKTRVRAFAMPKKMVEDYHSLLKEMKIRPLALDINSNAVSKLFSREMEINGQKVDSGKYIAVIDLGYRTTTVNVLNNRILESSRSIPIGCREFDSALAGYYNTPLENVDEIKRTSLDLNKFFESTDGSGEGSAAVKQMLNQWMSEILKVAQYFSGRTSGNKIEKAYIYGGVSNVQGFPEYMGQALSVDSVTRIDAMNNVLFSNHPNRELSHYINAVGALIRF